MLIVPVLCIHFVAQKLFPTEETHPFIDLILEDPRIEYLLPIALAALVAAPLVEEFFFRVLLQGWLEQLLARLESPTTSSADRRGSRRGPRPDRRPSPGRRARHHGPRTGVRSTWQRNCQPTPQAANPYGSPAADGADVGSGAAAGAATAPSLGAAAAAGDPTAGDRPQLDGLCHGPFRPRPGPHLVVLPGLGAGLPVSAHAPRIAVHRGAFPGQSDGRRATGAGDSRASRRSRQTRGKVDRFRAHRTVTDEPKSGYNLRLAPCPARAKSPCGARPLL